MSRIIEVKKKTREKKKENETFQPNTNFITQKKLNDDADAEIRQRKIRRYDEKKLSSWEIFSFNFRVSESNNLCGNSIPDESYQGMRRGENGNSKEFLSSCTPRYMCVTTTKEKIGGYKGVKDIQRESIRNDAVEG